VFLDPPPGGRQRPGLVVGQAGPARQGWRAYPTISVRPSLGCPPVAVRLRRC
jgi:hypothetical protein